VPLYAVYCAYYWSTPNQSYFRFLIVTMPLLVGSAYALLSRLDVSGGARLAGMDERACRRAARVSAAGRYAAMALLCAVIVTSSVSDLKKALRGDMYGASNRSMARVAREAAQLLDSDAVLLTRSPFENYVGTREDWTLYDLSAFQSGYARNFRPRSESPGPSRRKSPRRQEKRGEWFRTFYEAVDDEILANMKRSLVRKALSEGRQVAYLLPAGSERWEQQVLGEGLTLESVGQWDLRWEWGRHQQWRLLVVRRSDSP